MGDVVSMGPRKPRDGAEALVWTCGGCGGSTFQLLSGGEVRCHFCCKHSTAIRHFHPDEMPSPLNAAARQAGELVSAAIAARNISASISSIARATPPEDPPCPTTK
jgi:hypothetical protein